jgi:hypothetical protein
VSLEERFDFEVTLNACLKSSAFSATDWELTENFLMSGENYTDSIRDVLNILASKLGYTDVNFLSNKSEFYKVVYETLKEGERL